MYHFNAETIARITNEKISIAWQEYIHMLDCTACREALTNAMVKRSEDSDEGVYYESPEI